MRPSERQRIIDDIRTARRRFLENIERLAQHDRQRGLIRRPLNVQELVVSHGLIQGLIVKHS